MYEIKIVPSILSANFRCLEYEVKAAEDAGADMIHCDVMDGHFVPVITFGPMVIEAVKKSVSVPLDVHLMIAEPAQHISSFRNAGADIITVHVESQNSVEQTIPLIRASGARVGVTVNPDTPADTILRHLSEIDHVLIMTVFPGYGGQKFIPAAVEKVRAVFDAAKRIGRCIDIEVDGGVNGETARVCAAHGANVLVAGSYVFNSNDYAGRIKSVRDGALAGREELMRSGAK